MKWKQVTWNLPASLYKRMDRLLQDAQMRHLVSNLSLQDFAIQCLDTSVRFLEESAEKDRLIVLP